MFLIKEVYASLGIQGMKHVSRVFCSSRSFERIMKANKSGACLTVIEIRGQKIWGMTWSIISGY
jgi:hypothetical protein